MTRIFDEDLKAAFGTRAIHAGQRPDLLSGAIMTPIYTTSTYSSATSPRSKAERTGSRSRVAWGQPAPS